MKRFLAFLSLFGMLPTLSLSAPAAERSPTPSVPFNRLFYNPIGIGGDPWVTQNKGVYCHTLSGGSCVAITVSPSISGLWAYRLMEKIAYWGSQEGQTELWAPELHFYNGHWYMFYAATVNHIGAQRRIYMQRSATENPQGEWIFLGKVNLPDDQWAIDATFFPRPNGRVYLLWSGWKNEAEGSSIWKQYLYIAELSPHDVTQAVSASRAMISEPIYAWETSSLPQNEGPQILISPAGTTYCIYSGNFSKSDAYCLGALRLSGEDPMEDGAWEKLPEPLFASCPENDVYSPGHASFTKSPDGTEDWIVYHAARAKGSGWNRSIRAKRVDWIDDIPCLGMPDSLNTPIPLPSGETVNRVLFRAEDAALSEGARKVFHEATGNAVCLDDPAARADITFRMKSAGQYALYIRYSNSSLSDSAFRIGTNGTRKTQQVTAYRTGERGTFSMACVLLTLEEGINTVSVYCASPDIALDLFILDQTPMA